MPTTELAGCTILVTRPEHQAEPLCRLIESAGGTPLRLPALEIHDDSDNPKCAQYLAHLDDYQIVIFISPNAVNFGLDAITRCDTLSALPLVATVGKGSSRALQQRLGREPDLQPQNRYDSEGLLQLEALQQVSGKRVLIVRGNGGRELLAETLRQRGAQVDYAEVYRRTTPAALSPEDERLDKTDIIVISSGEGLSNLLAMTPPAQRERLLRKPLLLVSERVREQARELGFGGECRVSLRADDEAIVATLTQWVASNNGREEE